MLVFYQELQHYVFVDLREIARCAHNYVIMIISFLLLVVNFYQRLGNLITYQLTLKLSLCKKLYIFLKLI